MAQARERGLDVAFDMHTRLFGFTYLATVLPAWAADPAGPGLAAALRDPDARARMKRHRSILSEGGDWGRVVLLENPVRPEHAGRDLASLAAERGQEPLDVAYDLLLETAGAPHAPMVMIRCHTERQQREAFADPLCMPGSDATTLAPDGPLAGSVFHGAYGWAAWFYRFMVRETRLLSPQEAVRRLTSLPVRAARRPRPGRAAGGRPRRHRRLRRGALRRARRARRAQRARDRDGARRGQRHGHAAGRGPDGRARGGGAAPVSDDLGAVHPLGRERTVEQALARELRAAILAGRLPPGTRLPYRELATKFEVSITPVRIALRELAQEGLVLTRPHEGARVAPLSGAELEEIYAARSGFEGWLAHQGAPRLGDAALREMDRCLATLERAAAANDLRAYLDAGWAHRGVCYLAAGRPAMLARTEALYQRAARYNWLTLTGEGRLGESLSVARELHGACAARDGRRARALVRAALDQTMEHLVDRFADLETEQHISVQPAGQEVPIDAGIQ